MLWPSSTSRLMMFNHSSIGHGPQYQGWIAWERLLAVGDAGSHCFTIVLFLPA